MLKFSRENAKTANLANVNSLRRYLANGNKVYSFDLLAGHTCNFARDCRSCVINGKIQDGPHTKFRCFAASLEAIYPNVYLAHKHNTDKLRGLHLNDIVRKLDYSIPCDCGICRLHVSGDFFSSDYMLAWLEIARKYKYILFYAYTKALPYWIKYRDHINSLPNFILTASYGGSHDYLISRHNLRFAKVVFSKGEAKRLSLPIDHDDSHAARPGKSFALLLHGIQPAKSAAARALVALNGVGSYTR